jgi:hypothetical protein
MENIEQKISNLVEYQFPAFYQEEGPMFIAFVKAYYAWMEEEGNSINQSRNILNYRDLDETLESFLYYFQKKYLYGIPFNTIINKRTLLKHVLDAYRTKGSQQCFDLLFKLIYNQKVDLYIPSRDILRVSDGTWVERKYVEITSSPLNNSFVGKKIRGVSSGTTAVVESYVTEPINKNVIGVFYISNLAPKQGSFTIGEQLVVDQMFVTTANTAYLISNSPTVTGSLDYIEIADGGRDFKKGDILKIADRDGNNVVISYGREGQVKVTELFKGRGQLNYSLIDGGWGYPLNSETFVYNFATDTTGTGGDFEVGTLGFTKIVTYNTDVVSSYLDLQIDAASYGFPGPGATSNSQSNVGYAFSYANIVLGSIKSLDNLKSGNNYTAYPYTFVKNPLPSNNLTGTVTYNSTSAVITGTSTQFDRYLQANSVVYLQANSSDSNTSEVQIVKTVDSNVQITLYGKPTNNSTATAVYRVGPDLLAANFISTDPVYTVDGTNRFGLYANVLATPYDDINTIVNQTKAVASGRGYQEGEFVYLYLYGGVAAPSILNGGTAYTNNDPVLFAGGDPNVPARGYITTNSNGVVNSITMSFYGSGYQSTPTVYVKSDTGSNAVLSTTLTDYNYNAGITGRVRKKGIGVDKGFWSTTRGHLNSDKYIQDSYFYQDFSYQVQAALKLSSYRDILYNTFHVAGTELFGEYYLTKTENSAIRFSDDYGPFKATITFANNITVDSTSNTVSVDKTLISIDQTYIANTTI